LLDAENIVRASEGESLLTLLDDSDDGKDDGDDDFGHIQELRRVAKVKQGRRRAAPPSARLGVGPTVPRTSTGTVPEIPGIRIEPVAPDPGEMFEREWALVCYDVETYGAADDDQPLQIGLCVMYDSPEDYTYDEMKTKGFVKTPTRLQFSIDWVVPVGQRGPGYKPQEKYAKIWPGQTLPHSSGRSEDERWTYKGEFRTFLDGWMARAELWITNLKARNVCIVAHNGIRHDFRVILRNLAKNDNTFPGKVFVPRKVQLWCADSLEFLPLFPTWGSFRFKNMELFTIYQTLFNDPSTPTQPHTALADALLLRDVIARLVVAQMGVHIHTRPESKDYPTWKPAAREPTLMEMNLMQQVMQETIWRSMLLTKDFRIAETFFFQHLATRIGNVQYAGRPPAYSSELKQVEDGRSMIREVRIKYKMDRDAAARGREQEGDRQRAIAEVDEEDKLGDSDTLSLRAHDELTFETSAAAVPSKRKPPLTRSLTPSRRQLMSERDEKRGGDSKEEKARPQPVRITVKDLIPLYDEGRFVSGAIISPVWWSGDTEARWHASRAMLLKFTCLTRTLYPNSETPWEYVRMLNRNGPFPMANPEESIDRLIGLLGYDTLENLKRFTRAPQVVKVRHLLDWVGKQKQTPVPPEVAGWMPLPIWKRLERWHYIAKHGNWAQLSTDYYPRPVAVFSTTSMSI